MRAAASHHRLIVVGIINVTPDSFSDGGRAFDSAAAIAQGERLVAEGADWLDIGGESTRPGAVPIAAQEELSRIRPVIAALAKRVGVPLSVDTYKAAVAEAALGEGATIVNDISGGRLDPRLLTVAGKATLVLGHMRGTPATMQEEISFGDVVEEVAAELGERVSAARAAGASGTLIVDPGLGFGKRLPENLVLLTASRRLTEVTGCPVMIGASRKRFIGELSGIAAPEKRLGGSIGAALAAAASGAKLLRVHDVAETVQALAIWRAADGGLAGAVR